MKTDFNPVDIKLPQELENRLFFTPKEFGSLVGASRDTVYRWHRLGYIKLTKFSPRCHMVPKSELERYMRGEMMETGGIQLNS